MKKKILLLLILLTAIVYAVGKPVSGTAFALSAPAETVITESAKAAYLCDADSGTVLYSSNENERLPIASMTKIMTLLLVYKAIDEGKIEYEKEVTISENAAGMGGSQVFLDANSTHKVSDLVKAVVVASANDAAVALAETVSGSETSFVSKMNARANEMGLENTSFTNCTGLPAPNAYSSAKDVSVMLKKLLNHDKYFDSSRIWLEDYAHPDGRVTTITNTNKLVRFYNGCDAGKTGYTSESKFCLSASARRGDMRVIATVIGEENGKQRFADVSNMFNYAFANYENKILIEKGDTVDNEVEVVRGKQSRLSMTPYENVAVFSKKGDNDGIELVYNLPDKIKAPIKVGDVVGTVTIVKDGIVVKEVNVVAAEDVNKANFLDSIKKICGNW